MSTRIENIYRRWEGTIQLLILVTIPLAVYLYGENVSRSVQRIQTEQEYVRIASGILSQKVEVEDDSEAMRTWAADVLQKFSPIGMSKQQRDSLISGNARLQGWGQWGGGSSSYSYAPIYADEHEPIPDFHKKTNPK